MAKTQCRCGNILSNVQAPNDIELRVYSDIEWEEKVNVGIIDSVNIPFPTYDVWKCPKCERVYVYESGNDKPIKVYVLEE